MKMKGQPNRDSNPVPPSQFQSTEAGSSANSIHGKTFAISFFFGAKRMSKSIYRFMVVAFELAVKNIQQIWF